MSMISERIVQRVVLGIGLICFLLATYLVVTDIKTFVSNYKMKIDIKLQIQDEYIPPSEGLFFNPFPEESRDKVIVQK